jgi:hypothetical protein
MEQNRKNKIIKANEVKIKKTTTTKNWFIIVSMLDVKYISLFKILFELFCT